ncbi:MAG: GTPase HflX [Desulfurivibrionaceae bacterium]|nr:GTPase HflX [Desulfobulbales bacterium]MDT8334482.1 GTPase HflX [Desulfurivibrionaceae bacterium]
MTPDLVISPEVARELSGFSREIGRQIGLLIDRAGRVDSVIVGDQRRIVIPALDQARGAAGRLKGLRLVHTHLAGEDLSEDDLMDLLFLRLDMVAAIKVGEDGLPAVLLRAHLVPRAVAGRNWVTLPPVAPSRQPHDFRDLIKALEDEFARVGSGARVDRNRDRAILVSVTTASRARAGESMLELEELAESAGVKVLDTVIQRRPRLNPKLMMGKGKLAEIMLRALTLDANLLIFDQELNPSQIRSITDHTEMRVIDRTQLILDIFARRALSREGKLQIEMAQLKYMLPRLGTRDDALSRLTGGIGARGPGETRLEIDRRRIKDRLTKLAGELKKVGRERHHRRSRRRKRELPVISLVGYTNAGKSTLLNSLTHSAIVAADKLFATLDPTSRRLRFPRDMEVIITDTVGFIRDLPAELLQAFKSTLEELDEADLLVHVIDIANPAFPHHIRVVEDLLRELELDKIPCLKVFNKIDLVSGEETGNLARQYDAVPLSALHPETFARFFEKAQRMITKKLS